MKTKKAIESLNKVINEGLPGGSLKVAAISSRSVTLDEQFDRLLVIGYLGIDMPIFSDGQLGPPVATRLVLYEPDRVVKIKAGEMTTVQRDIRMRLLYLKKEALEKNLLRQAMQKVDQDLKTPKELDNYRKLSQNKDEKAVEIFKLFYNGIGDYIGVESAYSEQYVETVKALNRSMDMIEKGK